MPRDNPERWLYQIETEMRRHSAEAPSKPQIAHQKGWSPRVDVHETRTHVLVKAELAGVKGSQIKLHFSDDGRKMFLRGQRKEPEDSPLGECITHQLEIDYGEFSREIKLPRVPLDTDGTRGLFRHGMLVISIPKVEEGFRDRVTVKRTIKIKKV
ncbi:MAG: Hsp20/alpha crystallin family protein [Fimbriimonadaceae bacterium]